ncbi:MAG: ribonuclease G, partial [Pseudomonadales bacterium]|nr:ribonuclease G [Pseudomonadales bacterium]
MSEEILINVAPLETRVALLDNGVLQEIYLERSRKRGLVGNIYKGKISRVLPGMQAAFIDIGLDRAAFIHASDIAALPPYEQEKPPNTELPDIRTLIKEGDSLVVQVVKDPIGSKGAKLTTHLSVSSRFLVYMPKTSHIGISQRIEDENERLRLRQLLQQCIDDEFRDAGGVSGGFIIRTVAEGATIDDLVRDVRFLVHLWADLERDIVRARPMQIVYEDLALYLRTMRDLVKPSVEKVRIDSATEFERLRKFTADYEPRAHDLVEHYDGARPIFDLYAIDDEIDKALGNRVELKSGGYLVIDQTEAMTTVDVNTGAFVGSHNQDETIFKTNLEAAPAIARQLRLRNIGGIIIVDFIDMRDEEHRRQVLRLFEKALQRDSAKTSVLGVSELGLVEMTRKRTRESLARMMCSTCDTCQGRGVLKSSETICYEIFREVMREARIYDNEQLLIMASQAVIDRLLDEDSASVADLEALTGKT